MRAKLGSSTMTASDGAAHPIETRERIAVGRQALAEDRLDAREHLLVRGDEERLLVLEMVEEARPLDADAVGDLLHLRADEAVAGEDLLGGVDDLLAGVVGLAVDGAASVAAAWHHVYLHVCR